MFPVFVGGMLMFLTGIAAYAVVIAPELQQILQSVPPDQEVSVIVTLTDKVDVSRFKETDEGRWRSELLEALRRKAEATQEPVRAFLESRGATRVRSLWLINGMAVTARVEVIRELTQQPGIERIRLDTALSVPKR